MVKKSSDAKNLFAETRAVNNEFVKRFCIPSSTNKILFSEEYYMVSDKDFVKKFKIEESGVRPKFVGRTSEGKYYILCFADFAKLFDKAVFRSNLADSARKSLSEDASTDDYFKMLYSNTLRHVAYIFKNSVALAATLRGDVYNFMVSNFSVLDQDVKEIILKRDGIYGI